MGIKWKNPGLMWANLLGVDDRTARNYYNAVEDAIDLEGQGVMRATWNVLVSEPEGWMFLHKFYARNQNRARKVRMIWLAENFRKKSQKYGHLLLALKRHMEEDQQNMDDWSWGPF